jgi:hypothetical protein
LSLPPARYSSPSPSPPPPLAGQPASIAVSGVVATSVVVTVTPPAGGCTPVTYVIAHRRANTLEPPSLTTVPAGKSITARLGNLVTGVAYTATVVGVCADGTRTPPSAPVTFVPKPDHPDIFIYYVNNYAGGTVSVCLDAELTDCTASNGTGTFDKPTQVVVVGAVTLVTNEGTNSVSICDRLLTRCTTSNAQGTLNKPNGLAVGPGGVVYIGNYDGSSVSICADATLQSCTTSNGNANFNGPTTQILVQGSTTYVGNYDGAGDYVTVCTNRGLTQCTRAYANPGPAFVYPVGVAADELGNIYVADYNGVRMCTAGLSSCSALYPNAPTNTDAVSVVGSKVYVGTWSGGAILSICDLEFSVCTTTNGTDTFSDPMGVYRLAL